MAGSRFFPKLQSVSVLQAPVPGPPASGDPVRASIGHLLSRAYTLPCSTAAQAFAQLVQPTSRFQLALEVLLPILSSPAELAQRILVSYILYSLYTPYPISINPFRSALLSTFIQERNHAIKVANEGGYSENEQLVWVLWKILKGDGNDIGPYSPSTLARSPLVPELRAQNLFLDEEILSFDASDNEAHREKVAVQSKPIVDPEPPNRRVTPLLARGTSPSSSDVEAKYRTNPAGNDSNDNIARAMNLLLAARERVLTLSEQRFLTPLLPRLTSPSMITSMDLLPIMKNNPYLAYPLFVALLTSPRQKQTSLGSTPYLEVLRRLPPFLPSFDLLGSLLRDSTTITDSATGAKTTIADLIRMEVLGDFLHQSIVWLDQAERDESEGLISDDRLSTGIRNLCRFYLSLLKLSIVDASDDADTAEMAHFTLRHARFEEANALYSILASAKF